MNKPPPPTTAADSHESGMTVGISHASWPMQIGLCVSDFLLSLQLINNSTHSMRTHLFHDPVSVHSEGFHLIPSGTPTTGTDVPFPSEHSEFDIPRYAALFARHPRVQNTKNA